MAARARRHAKPNKDVPLGALVSQQESKEHPYRAGDIQRFKICTAEGETIFKCVCASAGHNPQNLAPCIVSITTVDSN